MTFTDLRNKYEAENNKRGLEVLAKIDADETVRLLPNEEDDAILKDLQSLDWRLWLALKNRSYVNSKDHWVICPTPAHYNI